MKRLKKFQRPPLRVMIEALNSRALPKSDRQIETLMRRIEGFADRNGLRFRDDDDQPIVTGRP